MRNTRTATNVPQLTLLDNFDKLARRDERLVSDLMQAVSNLKYLRINSRFSDLKPKKEIEESFNQILYWIAFLAWKKARYVEEYKGNWKLDTFLAKTQEKKDLHVTEILDNQTLINGYLNSAKRMQTTFMAYKDLLTDDRAITKRILDNFDNLHTLAHGT
jgi:hypothetical protein